MRASPGATLAAILVATSAWAQEGPVTPPAAQPSPLVAPAAEDDHTPPSMDAPSTTDSVSPEVNPALMDNAPPPMDAPADVPPATLVPPPERPFLARLGGMELGLAAFAVALGWVASAATGLVVSLAAASWASGRLQWDFPRTAYVTARSPTADTEGARIFGGQNGGVMMGAIAASALTGAFLSAGVATLLGFVSQDWETALGPVAAAGILAGAVCTGIGGSLFVASLVVPFPPLWMATFAVAIVLGVALPPLAAVAGQLFTKKARAVPGGLLSTLLNAIPMNPLSRGLLGGVPGSAPPAQ